MALNGNVAILYIIDILYYIVIDNKWGIGMGKTLELNWIFLNYLQKILIQ